MGEETPKNNGEDLLPAPTLSTRLLLVDDHPPLLTFLSVCLEAYGYEVLTATSGQTGLEILAETRPDLIISDIMMPGMDGFEFFEAVRNNPSWVDIPFIFLTAKGGKEDIQQGKLLGAEEYLVKPFQAEDLRVAIESRLRRARQLQQHARHDIDLLKKQLFRLLSHEFKTPLFSIRLAADLLSRYQEKMPGGDLQVAIDSIQQGQHRLTRLVEDILTMASIEAGLVEERYRKRSIPCRVSSLIEGTVKACQARADKHNIAIQVDLPSSELYVRGIERYLVSAFTRILNNAIKFSPAGGKVVIMQQASGGQLAIAFRDWGRGISADQLPHLFDYFSQVEREKYEQQGGGLGLSIARAYVEIHQGRVEVISKEGVGSTFTVWLPLLSKAELSQGQSDVIM